MRDHESTQLDVLMYHSISSCGGPTCIPLDTFRMQLDLLNELSYQTVCLDDVIVWLEQRRDLARRSVLITFDDGFRDFADVAWPQLQARGFGAVVFLPTGHVGGFDDWERSTGRAARALLAWEDVKQLAQEGVEFGGHSVHHWNLTQLSLSQVRQEVVTCKLALEEHLQRRVTSFAPPFGRSTDAVRAVIRETFRLSFGTVLGRTSRDSNPWDLPRLEMHYFRDASRWRSHLLGGGQWRLATRRSLRTIRQATADCLSFRIRRPSMT